MLDIFKVQNSKYSKVKISGSGINLEGILQNDLGVSGSNTFDNSFLLSGLVGEVTEGKAMLQRTANRVSGGRAGSDRSAINQEMSKYSWTGSARPEFTVQLALVALRDLESESVVAKSMQAMRCVYPDKSMGFLTAPLGYNSGQGSGTVRLAIGTWFNAYGLIVKSANVTYSKVCLKSGRPLFALLEVNLEPYKAITFGELRSYFKG